MIVSDYKKEFPIFRHYAKDKRPLAYLDSAATAQMPETVIGAMRRHEESNRANVHRGIYALSERATEAYEQAREAVREFLNARSWREIIFTRNTTESINLAAYSLGKNFLQAGDHVLVSRAEHHSNFLPWQRLCEEKGAVLDIAEVDETGFGQHSVLTNPHPKTKIAAFSHVSHVLGTVSPISEMARIFRERGILFLVDAAQSAAHLPIDVRDIDCDFLVFSGHKLGGPMGIGVLYGREEILEKMPPYLLGGGMIKSVTANSADWNELPYKFEAGTPNVSGAIGLAAAIDYIKSVGWEEIRKIDEELTELLLKKLYEVEPHKVRILGPEDSKKRGGIVSFNIDGIHPHDLATILDRDGICIRAGHHCAMPLHAKLGVSATARASFWIYNTPEDIEALMVGIEKAIQILSKI